MALEYNNTLYIMSMSKLKVWRLHKKFKLKKNQIAVSIKLQKYPIETTHLYQIPKFLIKHFPLIKWQVIRVSRVPYL